MKDKFENITFIPPKRQSRLNGELGLTVKDIAASLGIDPRRAREKLESRGMLERIKACDFNVVAFASTYEVGSHGGRKETTEYILDLNAAKWFVGKYNNKAGDKYLAYLVKHESDTMGLSTHTDPTNLTELLGNPDTILRLAQNWKDALAVAEEQKERADKAIRDRGKISSSREASVMGKLGAETKKRRALETKLDISKNWRSVTGWVIEFPDLSRMTKDFKQLGKMLSEISVNNGLGVKKIPDERWGKVNSYTREAVLKLLEKYGY